MILVSLWYCMHAYVHTAHCIAYCQNSVFVFGAAFHCYLSFYSPIKCWMSFLVTSCVCCLYLCLSVSVSCRLHCSALPVSLWCVCLPVHVSGALCCGGGASAASRGEELDVLTPALWLRASACVRWRKRHSKCVGFKPKHFPKRIPAHSENSWI